MPLSQQKFREIVLQLLYSEDVGRPEKAAMTELIMTELSVSKKNVSLAHERVLQIMERLSEIDPLIASVAVSYDFHRIQTVTRSILRLGVFELFFDDHIPPKVAIAEAIRLSRKFNSPESASFVNALLDHLYQSSLGTPIDPKALDQRAQALMQSEQTTAESVRHLEHLGEKRQDEEADPDA